MLLWTLWCMYLFELVFSFLLDIYPGVELLGYMVVLFLVFWGASILFGTTSLKHWLWGVGWEMLSAYALFLASEDISHKWRQKKRLYRYTKSERIHHQQTNTTRNLKQSSWYQIETKIYTEEWRASEVIATCINIKTILLFRVLYKITCFLKQR